MIQTLIKNNDFAGKYVAMKSFEDSTVVGYGESPKEASDKAKEKGYKEPVIAFLPSKDTVQIY
ncbi:MAG: DUF5678 domain-containing protein [Deltaproteobacteria bacterium]|jgi:hypothetical protein|nr:DUF5678 domain-containing protein [Deltaproteobacteria bacterium]MCL5880700.1 DUF5678 domain-containing protein [Deltaproteobacteria bacterium]